MALHPRTLALRTRHHQEFRSKISWERCTNQDRSQIAIISSRWWQWTGIAHCDRVASLFLGSILVYMQRQPAPRQRCADSNHKSLGLSSKHCLFVDTISSDVQLESRLPSMEIRVVLGIIGSWDVVGVDPRGITVWTKCGSHRVTFENGPIFNRTGPQFSVVTTSF